jgi:hypothetical protein
MCAEWRSSFVAFREWAMSNGYADGLEIDRRENDGPYAPDNCRWVTHSKNCRNRRSNVLVTAFGETKTVIEWGEDPRCSVAYQTLRQRIQKYGWDPERAITTPLTKCVKGERVLVVAA